MSKVRNLLHIVILYFNFFGIAREFEVCFLIFKFPPELLCPTLWAGPAALCNCARAEIQASGPVLTCPAPPVWPWSHERPAPGRTASLAHGSHNHGHPPAGLVCRLLWLATGFLQVKISPSKEKDLPPVVMFFKISVVCEMTPQTHSSNIFQQKQNQQGSTFLVYQASRPFP